MSLWSSGDGPSPKKKKMDAVNLKPSVPKQDLVSTSPYRMVTTKPAGVMSPPPSPYHRSPASPHCTVTAVDNRQKKSPALHLNVQLDNNQQTRLQTFCDGLCLPENLCTMAAKWNSIFMAQQLDLKQDNEFVYFACLIYISSIEARFPYGLSDPQVRSGSLNPPPVTVTQLLQKAHINIRELYQMLGVLKETGQLSETVQEHLLALERKYCVTYPLFLKFEVMFEEIFFNEMDIQHTLTANGRNIASAQDSFQMKKKLCWTMFVYAKGTCLSSNRELVGPFCVMLCCLESIIRSTPAFMLKSPFDDVVMSSMNTMDETALLQQLCASYDAQLSEVQSVYRESVGPLIQNLPQADGTVDVNALQALYEKFYKQEADINELLFLTHDPHLISPVSRRTHQQPVESNMPCPVTPVRAALNTVNQLKTLLNSGSDRPSEELEKYFTQCSVNPRESVSRWVQDLSEKFVSAFVADKGQGQVGVARQRFTSATRLYYRVMETLLKAEEQRLSVQDFGNLLNNPTFHKSLLACAAEVVIATYGSSGMSSLLLASGGEDCDLAFPWILHVFHLQAYDFYKVLESFIRHEPRLTKEVVQHLQTVEHKILDSVAWKADSSLYEALARSEMVAPCLPCPTSAEVVSNHPTSSAADMYLSPLRPPMTSAQSRVIRTHEVKLSPRRCKSQSLNLFLNKVCRLGYLRLQALCDRLHIAKEMQHKIWTCFEFCIIYKTEMMKNRHLDQMMMCCIYAISKVLEKEIKFKIIVSVYRSLPHSSASVYKRVPITADEDDSVIGFYNRVFMHNMKSYVLQFTTRQMPSLSPVPRSGTPPLTNSPLYQLPGHKNFFVSPLKDSTFKVPPSPSKMTPRSKQLYSFGEGVGSAEKLRTINETMRTLTNQLTPGGSSRSQRRMSFEMDEDAGGVNEVIVKRMKVESPSTRKCLRFDTGEDQNANTASSPEADKKS